MTVIFRTTARSVLPIVLTASVAFFLQGHNLPGGGFIGGTLAATGFALLALAYGREVVRSRVLRVDGTPDVGEEPIRPGRDPAQRRVVARYRALFAGGLALAVAGGVAPILLGFPFMTQAVALLHDVPLFGELELASALVFDLGVYVAVSGAVLTILAEVGAE